MNIKMIKKSENHTKSADPQVERVDPSSLPPSFRIFGLSEIYRTSKPQGGCCTSPLPSPSWHPARKLQIGRRR